MTTYTFQIKAVEFAYDDGDKSQEVLDKATELVVGKEIVVEDEDLIQSAIEELTNLDVYSVTYSQVMTEEEEQEEWDEMVSDVANRCDESGENFDHEMGKVLAGID